MKMEDTIPCPDCKESLKPFKASGAEEALDVEVGQVVVCTNCGAILTIGSSDSLVKMTKEEVSALPARFAIELGDTLMAWDKKCYAENEPCPRRPVVEGELVEDPTGFYTIKVDGQFVAYRDPQKHDKHFIVIYSCYEAAIAAAEAITPLVKDKGELLKIMDPIFFMQIAAKNNLDVRADLIIYTKDIQTNKNVAKA